MSTLTAERTKLWTAKACRKEQQRHVIDIFRRRLARQQRGKVFRVRSEVLEEVRAGLWQDPAPRNRFSELCHR